MQPKVKFTPCDKFGNVIGEPEVLHVSTNDPDKAYDEAAVKFCKHRCHVEYLMD